MKLQFSELSFSPHLATLFEKTCWRPRTLTSKRAQNPHFYVCICTRPCRNGPPGTQTRALQRLISDTCWAHCGASKTLPGTSKRKKRTHEQHTTRENKKQTTTNKRSTILHAALTPSHKNTNTKKDHADRFRKPTHVCTQRPATRRQGHTKIWGSAVARRMASYNIVLKKIGKTRFKFVLAF